MKTINHIGKFESKKLLIGLIILWGVIIGGCATRVTVPGADVAAGVFEQVGYEFMRWAEGADGQRPAAIMIWHDFLGDSGSFSESKRDIYTLQGYAEAKDGARFEWEVQTSDGETLQFWLDGQSYDLANGAMFIVKMTDGGAQVTQLDRDLSGVQPNHGSCVAFAKNDPDLARFIDAVSSSPGASPTPPLAVTPTPQTSASASDVASPTPSPIPPTSMPITELEPQRIRFAEGGTSATVHNILSPMSVKPYVLRAMAGQMLQVDIGRYSYQVAPVALGLSIMGENGTVLVQQQVGEAGHWAGWLPSTQDYVIKLASPDTSVAYDLTITIPELTEPTPDVSLYRNAEYGFELRYPPEFEAGETCPNAAIVHDPVISFRLVGDTYYAGTNLIDACVTVGVDQSAARRSTCMEARGAYNEAYVGQEAINGIPFTKMTRGGVAAGHNHDVTIYRTVRDAACYEVALFLHYSNMGVYEPGTVTEFDKDVVMQKLAQVLYTFRFTSVRGGDDASATDTAYDWGVYTHHAFGVSLSYPASWQPDEQSDGTKFVGPDGFFHISAMGADSLDEAVVAEAEHRLQPYGSQPVIEHLQVAGQEARLILPSADQRVAMAGQAALIVRYPHPIDLAARSYEYEYFVPGVGGGGRGTSDPLSASGLLYPFFVLWADQSHIRAIAPSVRFMEDATLDDTPTTTVPGLSITGTVMDVALSARVISLQTPVDGFDVIALTEESELLSADGYRITLRDFQPGEIIQVFGRPGESGTLIASQVIILDAVPTPSAGD